ncbi:MAG: PQQ-like beta-propeller repeat protein [Thermoplasmatales archaeon]|nr:MAG: PQQ-like beta-propeller repeat protein [Thermoplasmatales archaeon]
MNSNKSKIGAVVLAVCLLGTAFFVPASSVEIEQKRFDYDEYEEEWYSNQEKIDSLLLDRTYILNPPIGPINEEDNDDAGYKRDAGDQHLRANAIYPGEILDNWPGRGNTGKLELTYDEQDWYYFGVCNGMSIDVTLTVPTGYDFDLYLYDVDEVERSSSTNTGSTTETISYVADYSGFWYIALYFIDGAAEAQYTFSVALGSQDDANSGSDAGDDFATATAITGGTYDAYLDKDDDEDWYQFSVSEGEGIRFNLHVEDEAPLSDFDVYLYNPSGEEVHREVYYGDDQLYIGADTSGNWRARVKIFPGYTDIPQPTEWDYWTYGSGAYRFDFSITSSGPDPPHPIPQPDITPIAQTFKIVNGPGTNADEYGYLASIPACNYLEDGMRYLAPIVYTGDTTITEWFGTVDDTTNYLLDDWNDYLALEGKTAVNYYVPSDPIQAAAEIATDAWDSSNLAVVAVDGSSYEDSTSLVLQKSTSIKRKAEVETIHCQDTEKIQDLAGYKTVVMNLLPKWGAINITIDGSHKEPYLFNFFPRFMLMGDDWWPERVEAKYDIFYPVTSLGVWGAGVQTIGSTDDWDFVITKIEGDRHKIKVDDFRSTLKVTVATSEPSDLVVFLIDPSGHVRAPDIPWWNGGPINPIHVWNGIDHPNYPPDCDPWRTWDPEPRTEFSAEVLHPEKGDWTAIVVPRYAEGSNSIDYTITGEVKELNKKRIDAAISAANAAVIASQEHVPLLYVTEDEVPTLTQDAFDQLGVNEVIFVHSNDLGNSVTGDLPTVSHDLESLQDIIGHIKGYSHTENFITITSLKSGDGYFASSAYAAAYHCAPVLRISGAAGVGSASTLFIGEIEGNSYCYDTELEQFVWSNPEGWIPVDPNPNAPENSIYLGSESDIIYCINSETGDPLWTYPSNIEEEMISSGDIYLNLNDKDVYCISDTGDDLWSVPVSDNEAVPPASMADRIDSWRNWGGDYYHGNRAPGHLPDYSAPIENTSWDLLKQILNYFLKGEGELPPFGLDAKRYWFEHMHDGIDMYINDLDLDKFGREAYLFVAPRDDIKLELHFAMMGNNSMAGHIPGKTPAYVNDVVVRNIMYPALIYANPNRDVTTAQAMNWPDGESWTMNNGQGGTTYATRTLKEMFMSHGRTFDGHCLWDAHLERMNEGASAMYYSGHGTGGSGISAVYLQNDHCNYPEVIWYDAWRSYMYDSWRTPRDEGRRWFNPEPPNLYDIVHYKWVDQLTENLRSNAIFYMSCSTGQQFGPLVYLDHGAVIWYGNAGSGLCPQEDLMDDYYFEKIMLEGESIGEAYADLVWLFQRDFTTGDDMPMYGVSSLQLTTVHCIYGDPTLVIYSPEWTQPVAIDAVVDESSNAQPFAPEIDGPGMGIPNTEYEFTFTVSDPNNDDVFLYVDWGDGATEDYAGPYTSGEEVTLSHTFSSRGAYIIKAKAKDTSDAEGPWGSLQINIPRAKVYEFIQIIQRFIQRFPIIERILSIFPLYHKLIDL